MSIRVMDRAEAYRTEVLVCRQCGLRFKARIVSWVDVSRIGEARKMLLRQEFNVVPCPHCESLQFAEVHFFYEDFEKGLLVAVFPQRPEYSTDVEEQIRKQYNHYPHVEFLYDMTQLWLLIFLEDFFKSGGKLRSPMGNGQGEDLTLRLLHFLRDDPLLDVIKDKLNDIFAGGSGNLAAVLGQIVYRLEGMHPWPFDRRCICGADIPITLTCCGEEVELCNQPELSEQNCRIECRVCRKDFTSITCAECGRTYTWHLGIVDSLGGGEDFEPLFSGISCSVPHLDGSRISNAESFSYGQRRNGPQEKKS